MNRPVSFALLLVFLAFTALSAAAQALEGRVVDMAHRPVAQVSVVGLDAATHKPLSFTRTDASGRFRLPPHSRTASVLFTLMGYARDTIAVATLRRGGDVVLRPADYTLREAVIKAPTVAQRGDTLTYTVGAFKQARDKRIADVIARMPGLSVGTDGTIAYQGRRINKFYVEGLDLLGSNYAQASENISADDVRAVEIYENHQPVKMLRGDVPSEQAALNIKLKPGVRNVWKAAFDLGGGLSATARPTWLYDSRATAMRFARRGQSLSLYQLNNTGRRINGVDLRALLGEAMHEENGLVTLPYLPTPGLAEQRTRFNASQLVTSNWLFKPSSDVDLRLNLSGYFDRTTLQQSSTTTYTAVTADNTVGEEMTMKNYTDRLEAELHYLVNAERTYLRNEARVAWDFSHAVGRSGLFSGLSGASLGETNRYVRPHKLSFTDELALTRKLDNGRRVSAGGYAAYHYLPSTLITVSGQRQQLDLRTYFGGASAGYGLHLWRFNVRFTLTDDVFVQRLHERNTNEKADYARNFLGTTIAFTNKTAMWSWRMNLPLGLRTEALGDARRTRFVAEPSAVISFKPDAHWTLTSDYSYADAALKGTSAMAVPIFTDALSRRIGPGHFFSQRSHTVAIGAAYKHTRRGFFANANLAFSTNAARLLYAGELDGAIYTTRAEEVHRPARNLRATVSAAQTVGARLSFNLSANAATSRSHQLISGTVLPTSLSQLTTTAGISYKPLPVVTIEGKSGLMVVRQERKSQPDVPGVTNATTTFTHEVGLYVTPSRWVVGLNGEVYHGHGDDASFNFFTDVTLRRKFSGSSIEVKLSNLFGNSTYERRSVSSVTTVYSVTRLRPRELLVTWSIAL